MTLDRSIATRVAAGRSSVFPGPARAAVQEEDPAGARAPRVAKGRRGAPRGAQGRPGASRGPRGNPEALRGARSISVNSGVETGVTQERRGARRARTGGRTGGARGAHPRTSRSASRRWAGANRGGRADFAGAIHRLGRKSGGAGRRMPVSQRRLVAAACRAAGRLPRTADGLDGRRRVVEGRLDAAARRQWAASAKPHFRAPTVIFPRRLWSRGERGAARPQPGRSGTRPAKGNERGSSWLRHSGTRGRRRAAPAVPAVAAGRARWG